MNLGISLCTHDCIVGSVGDHCQRKTYLVANNNNNNNNCLKSNIQCT